MPDDSCEERLLVLQELKKSIKKFQEEDKACLTKVQLRLQYLSSVVKNLGDTKSDDSSESRRKFAHQG